MPDVGEVAVDDALFGEVLTPRVQQIIRLEREADDAQWEAARLIAEELAEGKSQRQLAREIGKSQGHVRFMNRCWTLRGEYYSIHPRPSFGEFYNSSFVRAAEEKAESEPVREPEPLPGLEAGPVPESAPKDSEEEQSAPGGTPLDEGEDGTADDLIPDQPPALTPTAGEPESQTPQTEPQPTSVPALTDEAREELERLQRIADEEERANPEEPVAELLDMQRALRALIPKTRLFRAAGLEINAALASRIDSMYQEWRRLL